METLKSSKLFIDRCSLLNHPALVVSPGSWNPISVLQSPRQGQKVYVKTFGCQHNQSDGVPWRSRERLAPVWNGIDLGGFQSQYPQLWDLGGMHWIHDLGLLGYKKEFAGWFLVGKIDGWELGVPLWRKIVENLSIPDRLMKPLYAVFFLGVKMRYTPKWLFLFGKIKTEIIQWTWGVHDFQTNHYDYMCPFIHCIPMNMDRS